MSHTKLGLKLFTEVWMLLTLAMNLILQEPIMWPHKRLRIRKKENLDIVTFTAAIVPLF